MKVSKLTPLQRRIVKVNRILLPRPLAALVGEMTPQEAGTTAQRLAVQLEAARARGEITNGGHYDDLLFVAGCLSAHWHKCRRKLDDGWVEQHLDALAGSKTLRQNIRRLLKPAKGKRTAT